MTRALVVGLVAFAALVSWPAARAAGPPPPGPALEQPQAVLDASLVCSGDLAGATRDPVLLVHGTAENPSQFSWNWVPMLTADGIPHCTVALVDNATADIQTSAEHVVHAIRRMHELSGRAVDIVGHSQGGMIPRWAIRFWPDVRAAVDDLVGIAASNHGTLTAVPFCVTGCAAAIWQQSFDSAFLAALNDGAETYAGISYTQIYTHYDAIVLPNLDSETGSTSLHTGDGTIANIAVQDVCPLAVTDHLTIGLSDAVAYALARDALDHDGPADAARIPLAVCAQPFMPAVDPASFASDMASVGATIAASLAAAPTLPQEPALRCYVTNTCAAASAPAPAAAAAPTSTLPATGGSAPRPWLAAVALAAVLVLRSPQRQN